MIIGNSDTPHILIACWLLAMRMSRCGRANESDTLAAEAFTVWISFAGYQLRYALHAEIPLFSLCRLVHLRDNVP